MAKRFLLTLERLWLVCFLAVSSLLQPVRAQDSSFDLHGMLAAAKPGASILVPAGVYAGPLLIDKAVTLEGQGEAIIQGPEQGDVVVITAPGVTLRGFTVRGTGISLDLEDSAIRVEAAQTTIENNRVEDALFGIYLANAPDSIIRGNTILGKDLPISRRGDTLKVWYSARSLIEDNTIRDGRDSVIWFSPHTVVRNNDIEDNRYGLHFMQTDDHIIENNKVRNNSVGIYLMYGKRYQLQGNLLFNSRGPSGYGLGLKETDDINVRHNQMISNRVGIYDDATPLTPKAYLKLFNNVFAYNETGVLMLPNVKNVEFQENLFLDNAQQVGISGEGDLLQNRWAIGRRGNYWSDYNGFDANGDAIGDLPYQSRSLYESLVANHPALQLFQLSPATNALDLAAKAFPIFQPRPIMADPYPLTEPPSAPTIAGLPVAPRSQNLAVAFALVLCGALILGIGLRRFFYRGYGS
jgi:nitrous oxidase accessory protein